MDIRYRAIGNLVAIAPLTARARNFIAAQWPAQHTPNIIADTDGGRLMSKPDFADALVAIADAGLEAVSRDEYDFMVFEAVQAFDALMVASQCEAA